MEQNPTNMLSLLLQIGAHPQRAQAALKILDASSAGLEKSARAISAHTAEMVKATKAGLDAVAPLRQMHEVFRALAPELNTTTSQTDQHATAVQRSTAALREQSVVGAQLVSGGLAGLIAGRKAQAAVEAVWETARGVALLAEGTWPPNPAAIMAAGLHFEAAAQYALLAGSGGHRRSASSGSYGASSPGPSGIADFGTHLPSPELAPGAAGAAARFSGSGVVIIRGTQAFENYVASAVNGAVARGVSVTATSAQRGSPVGH